MKTANLLVNETSPYLLQHAYNPVAWYPWCDSAFEKAKKEDKPVFLSVGYSTCHWCHVMENESFEDEEIAAFLNEHFISIKVDREERPDIDSVYMTVCQTLTGSGGWPLTVIMTPQQQPFFAGTYFPKTNKYGRIGLKELLYNVNDLWKNKRNKIDENIKVVMAAVQKPETSAKNKDDNVIQKTYDYLLNSFDETHGGFGNAPKFPAAHNLLFLLDYYSVSKDEKALSMTEKTLISMYKGGIFDHIGYGFSRYSTDRFWLVPHFEKMLYDNTLLLSAYVKAYSVTKKEIYKNIAEKIITYVFNDLSDKSGAFYSAQDADVSGEEGKFYTFSPSEIINILGNEAGKAFNQRYNITDKGNFEGKNIPNLLKNDLNTGNVINDEEAISKLYEYRKNRFELKTDDKILTSWNCLMIAALAQASVAFNNPGYLDAAVSAFNAINKYSKSGNLLFSSYREGKRSNQGFLDDYAFYVYACIWLYKAGLNTAYIDSAFEITEKIIADFSAKSGFYLSGKEDNLIFRPIETYDGAMPSGNSVMCYNLIFLSAFTGEKKLYEMSERQIAFMKKETSAFWGGASFFSLACLFDENLTKAVCVLKDNDLDNFKNKLSVFDVVRVLNGPSLEYPLKNNMSTFYLCKGGTCLPPQNELPLIL